MATGFAQAGADVVISSRHEDELQATAKEIRSGPTTRVEYVVADMTRRDEANRLAAAAIEAMGRVDILVNNAGSNLPQPIDQIRDEDWDRLIELNLSSCMALTRALVPPMKERQVGPDHPHLVDHGLRLGRRPQRLLGDQERAPGPGPGQRQRPRPVRHHRQLHRPRAVPDRPARQPALAGAARRLRPHAPRMGRWGQPEELIGPALLLASEAGSYITGTSLIVDGGCLAKIF